MAKPKMNWRMPEEIVTQLKQKENQTEFVENAIRKALNDEKQKILDAAPKKQYEVIWNS